MALGAVAEFGETLLRHLQEMRRGAVRFQGGIVLILFIDEEPAGVRLVFVHLIHEAARLLARFGCEFFKDRDHFALASNFCHPGYGKPHHPSLRSMLKYSPKRVR